MPEPSFRFDPGQCSTLTPLAASSACSASVTCTQCAAHRRGVARLERRQVCDVVHARSLARTAATSSRCSDACVWTSQPCSAESAAVASSSSREQEIANRGRERRHQPAVRRAVPPLRNRDALVQTFPPRLMQPRRRLAADVHQALADDGAQSRRHRAPRTPRPCRAPSPSSARTSCRRESARRPPVAPRRRAWRRRARPREARCARAATRAAAGRRRLPRNSVWQRWMCVWTKPGSDDRAVRVDRRVRPRAGRRLTDRPTATMRLPSTQTSPRTTSQRVVHRDDECRCE